MNSRKRPLIIAFLLVICVIIHIYSRDEDRVENGYSARLFVEISRFLRTIFGKLNFSLGDILYGFFVAWIIWKVFGFIKLLITKKNNTDKRKWLLDAFYRFFVFTSCMYIVFNIAWGINYDRKGIAWQLGLDMKKYSRDDLVEINSILVGKINQAKTDLIENRIPYPSNKEMFRLVSQAYKHVSVEYPFLNYEPASLKSSLWGWLGNYTGFTGYYNPFTGEAQVNTSVPAFLQPYIACHEVAHQLGYAKEREANFVGFLSAKQSGNSLLNYSAYLDLFLYANRNLYYTDTAASRIYRKALHPAVIADIKQWTDFNKRHQSWAEPVIRWIYGKYLEGNRQPKGILSYDEVTAFIIAYYKKFGSI